MKKLLSSLSVLSAVAAHATPGLRLNGKTFDGNNYTLAIEDLNLGDRDYNGMDVLCKT